MDQLAKNMTSVRSAAPNTIVHKDDSGVEHTIDLPRGPLPSSQPNNMVYKDNSGVVHSIYLPQGTMHTAWVHLENKRWDELAKFAPYKNQGYTADDFNKHQNRDSSNKTIEDKTMKEI
ncbi:hypothetical protein F4859DRAFT_484526, partial [Xylaria cf. heliscus]